MEERKKSRKGLVALGVAAVVIVAAGLVGGLIGAVIGQKALKKHFIKAGLVSVK